MSQVARSGPGLSWHTLPALAAGMCLGYLTGGLLPEVVTAMESGLGLSATAAGGIATTSLLATAIAGLVFARPAARSGRPRLAMLGAAIGAAGLLLGAWSTSWWLMGLALVATGIGGGIVLAAASSALGAMADPDRASGAAILVNTLIGAALLAVIPVIAGDRHQPVMLLLAAVFLVGLPFLRKLPEAPAARLAAGSDHVPLGLLLIIGGLLFRVLESGLWAFAEDIAHEGIGVEGAALGALLSGAALAGLVGAGLQLWVGDRFGRFWPVLILILLDLIARSVLLTTHQPAVFVSANLIWWGSYIALFAYLLAMAASLDTHGHWAARVAAIMVFGDAVAPLLAGWVVDAGGIPLLAVVSVVGGLIPVVVLSRVAYVLDRTSRIPHPSTQRVTVN